MGNYTIDFIVNLSWTQRGNHDSIWGVDWIIVLAKFIQTKYMII